MLQIRNLQIPDWDHDTLSVNAFATTPTEDFSSTDHFRMFDFKVNLCQRGRPHDWTDCPYAHPGEKARRRDPRKHHYSATPCPDLRKGYCNRGDSCHFAHGVFECWLHPSRYRTQPCKDGTFCRRRVCFFAHTANQLRVLNHEHVLSSPTSVLNSSSTLSTKSFRYGVVSAFSVDEIVRSMRNVQLDEGSEPDFEWISELVK
ncbi:zinc finger CCCH domain-containing protein 23-like [Lotus japonicus]|uniref:zinc finger CCCH domain-containing protein 23-like n=1 Tax=Lotus japonicus TaxID=34305 RepID=UPI0025825830|nr:zinc finger CCCH domain-containing protein 23-like [Lotus japonicus]